MPIKINKPQQNSEVSSSNKNEEANSPDNSTKPKKTRKKPVKRKGSHLKHQANTKTPLQSLESTLERFHSQSDEELLLAMQPTASNESKSTHRLEEDQKEARLVLLHRMMIRKIPPEEIAKQLGVSIAMYYKLRAALQTRMRLDVNKVDVPYLIGDTLAFYDEVRSMALTMSSSTAIKSAQTKVAAMSIALRAEADKNDFLTKCGVYSAPVVEHIVRGMVSTGNYSVVDGASERVSEAHEINTALAQHLKSLVVRRLQTNPEIADNCNPVVGASGGESLGG